MGVFDEAVKIATRKNAAAADKGLPGLGALDPKKMTDPQGVSGTTGIDAKLIHGDRWQEIKGNLTENIEKDLKTDIKENEEWTVHEKLTFAVNGKTEDTRGEEVFEYFHNESRFEYFLGHTDLHHEQDHQINPTHKFDILNVECEAKNIEAKIAGTTIEGVGMIIEVAVGKAEAKGAGAEAWGAKVGAGGFANEAVAIDVAEKELKAELKGMHDEITALNAHIGGPRTLIMPVRIGICIAIHVDSPWA